MKDGLRAVLLAFMVSTAAAAQQSSQVDESGTLHLGDGEVIPYSDLASPEARKNFIEVTRGYEALLAEPDVNASDTAEAAVQKERGWYDKVAYIPWLAKIRQRFAVDVEAREIGGVHTDVVEPRDGIAARNQYRVLINLHGGGMMVGARYGGQLESIPVSSLWRMKVVTVDYRMAPENRYPAAEDDVIAVYRELLKSYRPENIGIYGCSSGASLTGSVVAKLIATGQPKPGAIGMFGEGPFEQERLGDSNYIFAGGKPIIPNDRRIAPDSYLAGLNMDDHEAYPVGSPGIQRKFPPSLLMSGTRDLGLSSTVHAHSVLVDRGVEAELHVWEGTPHCAFAQPFIDPDAPETRQAWNAMIKFFDAHLGRRRR